jgi:hypothetical protein
MSSSLFLVLIIGLLSFGYILSTSAASENKESDYIIEGEIYFDDYQQGIMHVAAFSSKKYTLENRITYVEIEEPGQYKLSIPAEYDVVYIFCYNDADDDGPPNKRTDPRFEPEANPVLLLPGTNIVDLYSLEEKQKLL